MRISLGFTGTQQSMTEDQKKTLSTIMLPTEINSFHHGDCIGADSEASNMAELRGIYIVCHPPINETKRAFMPANETRPKKDYISRNHQIVIECDKLVATPKEFKEQLRSGTWATIRYARSIGRPVVIIYPDGSIG